MSDLHYFIQGSSRKPPDVFTRSADHDVLPEPDRDCMAARATAAQGFGYMYFFSPENKIAPRFIARGGGNVALEETHSMLKLRT